MPGRKISSTFFGEKFLRDLRGFSLSAERLLILEEFIHLVVFKAYYEQEPFSTSGSPPPVQKLKHENGRVKVCSGGRLLILNQTEKFYRDLSNRKQKCKSQKMFHVVIALEKDIPVYKEKLWSGNNYENVGQGSTQHEPYLLFRRFVQVHVQHTTG
ncbi:uncharacterized protein LOC144666687 [Oculina patagonica]